MNRIVAAIASQRWLITPEGMRRIVAQLPEPAVAGQFIGDLFAARPEAASQRTRPTRAGAVAVVAIRGPIVRYDSWFTMLFGGTSVEWLGQQFRELAADESVSAILMDVDSPGGTIDGLPELAAVIRAAREAKPIGAISNPLNCSACYWLTAQADEIVSTPEGITGSVGVYTEHWDFSAMLEAEGLGHEFIQFGQFKTEGNEFEPLTDDAREHIQSFVNDGGALFLADVAKGRGITVGQVRADYGEGRWFTAKDAKAKGLIDRIGSFADAIGRASSGKIARRAVAPETTLTAEEDAARLAAAEAGLTADEAVTTFDFERERRERTGKRPVSSAPDSAGAFLGK